LLVGVSNYHFDVAAMNAFITGFSVVVLHIFLYVSAGNSAYSQIPDSTSALADTVPRKPVYSLDEVMQVAVRYFYPDGIDSVRGIRTYICDKRNGMADLEIPQDTDLKEFCYQTISQYILNGKSSEAQNILHEYTALCKKVRKMNWSRKADIKLTRIQGAIWYDWSQNVRFRSIIIESYEREKQSLSFVIQE
jgi:hypothetical protein